MTVRFEGMTFPAKVAVGQRVDITVTISNDDFWGQFWRCGVSIKDQAGVPFVVWDDIEHPELSYEYESPVISAFMMPNQPWTFHGHYIQTPDILYPAEIQLHWRDVNASAGSPWNTEPTSYVFTVTIQVQSFTLEVSVAQGQGNAYFEGGGVYPAGSVATVTAVPATNYSFDHWRVTWGGSVTDVFPQNPLGITMNDNVVAEAFFREIWIPPTYYYLTVGAVGNGSWTGAKSSYLPGETATVTAVPGDGNEFVKWIVGSETFLTPTISVTMNGNKTATAYFQAKTTYALAVQLAQGSGSWAGAKTTYNPGETATLTALPATGFKFWKWVVGSQTLTTAAISFTMNGNKTAKVYFIPEGTEPPPDGGGGIGSGIGMVILVILLALGLSGKKKK